jgi:hypothetical protein
MHCTSFPLNGKPRERRRRSSGLAVVTALMPSLEAEMIMRKARTSTKPTAVSKKRKAKTGSKRSAIPTPSRKRATAQPTQRKARENSKLATVVAMLRSTKGATIEELAKATGWQEHSVRGAISGAIKKKLALNVTSSKTDGVRTYRISA